jgi:AcrR family transcriptional regulator
MRAARTLLGTGMPRPTRPDKLLRALVVLRRWGLTPAAVYGVAANLCPERAAIVDELGALSFEQVNRRTNALARALRAAGVGEHDTVAIMCRNHRGFIRTGSSREQASELQRTRILSAMVEVASEVGTESATVTQIVRRAGVSSGTFYALFEDRQDCLTAVFEEAVAIATERVSAAYDTEATWVDRVRAAVLALLELLDEERELARLCVGHAVASPAMLMRRGQVLDELIPIIDQGRSASRASRNPPPLAAQVVLGGALGLMYARLSARDPCSLVELLNPLMSLIVLPYLGASAAREEQYRTLPVRRFASG